MVARILAITENKQNLAAISLKLQKPYYSLMFSKSMEDSLRIIRTEAIDLVFLSLPKNFSEKSSKLFLDSFSVLRELCNIIPIIGVAESENQVIPPVRLEDVVLTGIKKNDLIQRLRTFINLKNKFNDAILNNLHLEERGKRKIVSIFHSNVDFLHKSIFENTEVIQLNSWIPGDHIDNSDLFILNAGHRQAYECCANLRLMKTNPNKAIAITYDKYTGKNIHRAIESDIGATDFLDITASPFLIKFRLDSLMRYKKMYEVFLEKLKKSLYLSVLDSTTEVYNRSFFDDYLKNKEHCMSASAIAMVDVDKFKTINDKHGHSFADSMLKHISGVIKKYIRSSDIVARYGGDEFIILMNDISKRDAVDVVNRIQKKIENSVFHNAHCTVSIGICCVEPNGSVSSYYDAISIADRFMYAAKQNGGNSIKVCA